MSHETPLQKTASLSFSKAIERFTSHLSPKQRAEFKYATLEDVHEAIQQIQETRGRENGMRGLARMQAFLEAMDQYRKVIQSFENCTPFLGYVWVREHFLMKRGLAYLTFIRGPYGLYFW